LNKRKALRESIAAPLDTRILYFGQLLGKGMTDRIASSTKNHFIKENDILAIDFACITCITHIERLGMIVLEQDKLCVMNMMVSSSPTNAFLVNQA
jgi:hypothetical protein